MRIPKHFYSVGIVLMVLMAILDGSCSLRGSVRTMRIAWFGLGFDLPVPHWTTARLWLLRLGLFKLFGAQRRANDWIWILDHTVQVGKEKCLVILGIRQSQLPQRPLRHSDVETLAILPVTFSNGEVVAEQICELAKQVGAPREIVADFGSDVRRGIGLFCEDHPFTAYIRDIKHETASLLKASLESFDSWRTFLSRSAICSSQLQQTELAALRPPKQRSKARYMNLDPLVGWGTSILNILDGRTKSNRGVREELDVGKKRLEETLGWVREYRRELQIWRDLHRAAKSAEDLVRNDGYTIDSGSQLRQLFRGTAASPEVRRLQSRLIDFVHEQAAKAKPGERLLGSTEILESVFGRFKEFERDQRSNGLTGSLLAIAAMTGPVDAETVFDAMNTISTADVYDWSHDALGNTVQSKRRRYLGFLQPKAKELGQDIGTKMGPQKAPKTA